jgi:hypothetical protein
MDFFQINTREIETGRNKGQLEVYPDFVVGRSKDLMVRGRAFYAIWDDGEGLWSTDEYDVQRLVDHELAEYSKKMTADVHVKYMRSFGTNGWNQFRRFMSQISDNAHQLDETLTFANTDVKKTDYVSRRLPYHLSPGDISAWNELVGTLYAPEERAKIEWAIGAVVSGDSKKIQKFLVLYGPAGTGKSTVLNIIQKLFDGYTASFEAKALASNGNAFATEVFKNNPLVAIQHDGDLSRIEDNTKINSIVSHEWMTFNEKYKPSYDARANAMLWMGTNQPVRISDAKSGIIRRLIDVHPTGEKLHPNHYHTLMGKIEFELGAIAHHCLEVYRSMGKNFYNTYRPLEMMLQTDIFFNFVEANFDIFKAQDGATLKQAYSLYKEYCESTGIERPLPQYKVREELRNYFREFHDRSSVDGVVVRSYYSGFTAHPFKAPIADDAAVFSLVMEETTSIFDREYADAPAQLAKEDGTPAKRWSEVKTTLAEIDTSQLHFVKVPENHIVIDFDLEGDDGEKSLERNLAAASVWPPTYAELSRSGNGIHLHYHYDGDVGRLDENYSEGIEVKRYGGNASLRRRVTRCNDVPIATINSGLPLKEKKVLQTKTIQSERGLREQILKNMRKEFHPGTKPSIDFIHKILEDAYYSDLKYDVSDLKNKILAFANNSTNQPLQCLKVVQKMRWKSDEPLESAKPSDVTEETRLTFFDVETFPNLFVVCWKYQNDPTVVRMINPTPAEIEGLFMMRLVGFNCKRYDNHMLWAAWLGYNNEQLYRLSEKIINGSIGAMFSEAFNLSYADVYDFASIKQGLKKWEIQLGIHHMELGLPFDQPVDPKRWKEVTDYCANDVMATEVVFDERRQDFVARQILADLSGLTVNDSTQKLTARIIFGEDRNPQRSFRYTKLDKEFPGYVYDRGKSTYRGEEVGEGGYVYAEPGMYRDVALLDVASMHPTSIIQLNAFGKYTDNFRGLLEARLAIKSGDFDLARQLLGGRLAPYLGAVGQETGTQALSDALKIVINIVYGLTSAKFDNPFRDNNNIDNFVAKRGALFMIDLKHEVQERGFTVAHIKTDSIKIPNATPEIIEFVKQFGEKYGYTFAHEATYEKFCLVNDAVYIAKKVTPSILEGYTVDDWKTEWIAVGAQFQHPYVFKTLFSKEEPNFYDFCETKSVLQGAMYLDFQGNKNISEMHFVGRTGQFTPVREGFNGGQLYRVKDDNIYAVAGTKGYSWIESEMALDLPQEAIDREFFDRLADEAYKTIGKFGSFEEFVE